LRRDEQPNGSELTEAGLETRLEFARIGTLDTERLAELRPILERHVTDIVNRFYDHLLAFDELKPLLADRATVARLKGFQRDYLMSLVTGPYDSSYARDRFRIGKTHDRIGLEPEWYLGTYGMYLDLLVPLIRDGFASQPDRGYEALAAVTKVMILDMQLVLRAFHGLRQKRAVERTEKLAAVGELAASIAHEVRNPLAGMRGALQILRKDLAIRPSNLEVVDEVVAQIDRLENLVRDLLTYARPAEPQRQSFDVQELIDRVLQHVKESLDGASITVHRVYGPSTGHLVADPRQMEQVFINLIHNSVQAMPEGGTLSVTTRAVDRNLVITFRDTGDGIATADLQKVMQPFFTTRHRGSGLGLPIVKRITETHGGTLELRSEKGEGTTAIVTLPMGGV
jgi:signal transduction histidine kinase